VEDHFRGRGRRSCEGRGVGEDWVGMTDDFGFAWKNGKMK
jgi:hypothetical protein